MLEMKEVGEYKNLGVGIVGSLKKKQSEVVEQATKNLADTVKKTEITKKELKEGEVNERVRTAKVEYLRHRTKTVGIINKKGEYEVVPTKQCSAGDTVWVLEDDGTFTKTKIY